MLTRQGCITGLLLLLLSLLLNCKKHYIKKGNIIIVYEDKLTGHQSTDDHLRDTHYVLEFENENSSLSVSANNAIKNDLQTNSQHDNKTSLKKSDLITNEFKSDNYVLELESSDENSFIEIILPEPSSPLNKCNRSPGIRYNLKSLTFKTTKFGKNKLRVLG